MEHSKYGPVLIFYYFGTFFEFVFISLKIHINSQLTNLTFILLKFLWWTKILNCSQPLLEMCDGARICAPVGWWSLMEPFRRCSFKNTAPTTVHPNAEHYLNSNRSKVLCINVFVFNRGDTVSRWSPIKGVRPSPYTTLCS